jgi:hypothetical protein
VLDPAGEQWLPTVSLIYRGTIVGAFSSGLIDGSSGDSKQEMCYRLNYAYPFYPDAAGDPKVDVSILITQLTKDQPEILPYGLIAHAQNQLAVEGIQFSYVILNHGVNIVITEKPETLTETDALRKVNTALTGDGIASGVFIFDLQDTTSYNPN